MIKTILLAIMAVTHPPLTYTMPDMQIAQAGVQEAVVPEVVPEAEQEESCNNEEIYCDNNDYYAEPQEELPTPADEYEYTQEQWTPLGVYTVTWYSAEACGNSLGALGVGLTAGYSCALPEYCMLGHTVLIEGYGIYRCEDISPDGIADIFVWNNADIPSYGMDSANVYLLD